jgi:hypothetical protein
MLSKAKKARSIRLRRPSETLGSIGVRSFFLNRLLSETKLGQPANTSSQLVLAERETELATA